MLILKTQSEVQNKTKLNGNGVTKSRATAYPLPRGLRDVCLFIDIHYNDA